MISRRNFINTSALAAGAAFATKVSGADSRSVKADEKLKILVV